MSELLVDLSGGAAAGVAERGADALAERCEPVEGLIGVPPKTIASIALQ